MASTKDRSCCQAKDVVPILVGGGVGLAIGSICGHPPAGASLGVKLAVSAGIGAAKGAGGFATKQVASNVMEDKPMSDHLVSHTLRGVVVGATGGVVGAVLATPFVAETATHHKVELAGNALVRGVNMVVEHKDESKTSVKERSCFFLPVDHVCRDVSFDYLTRGYRPWLSIAEHTFEPLYEHTCIICSGKFCALHHVRKGKKVCCDACLASKGWSEEKIETERKKAKESTCSIL